MKKHITSMLFVLTMTAVSAIAQPTTPDNNLNQEEGSYTDQPIPIEITTIEPVESNSAELEGGSVSDQPIPLEITTTEPEKEFPVDSKKVALIVPPVPGLESAAAAKFLSAPLQFGAEGLVISATALDKDLTANHAKLDAVIEKDGAIVAVIPAVGDRNVVVDSAAYLSSKRLPVMLVTFTDSLRGSLPAIGKPSTQAQYTFEFGSTAESQFELLAKFLTRSDGSKPTLAIVRPDNEFGRVFEAGAAKFFKLSQTKTYPLGATSFTKQAEELAKIQNPSARADFKSIAAECDQKFKDDSRAQYRTKKCKESAAKNLKAKPDFDFILVADSAKKVRLVVPALAAANLETRADVQNSGTKPTPLVGIDIWNDSAKDLMGDDSRFFSGAVFPATIVPNSNIEQSLRNKFKTQVKRNMLSLDLLLLEAGQVLNEIIAKETPASRSEMREVFRLAGKLRIATGTTQFESTTQQAKAPLFLITIKDGQFVQIPHEKK